MKSEIVTSEEKLWLLALVRGPLAPASVKRPMSDQVRDSLLAKGLIHWRDDFVEITQRGIALVEGATLRDSNERKMVA
jgi:hypothetical protein